MYSVATFAYLLAFIFHKCKLCFGLDRTKVGNTEKMLTFSKLIPSNSWPYVVRSATRSELWKERKKSLPRPLKGELKWKIWRRRVSICMSSRLVPIFQKKY